MVLNDDMEPMLDIVDSEKPCEIIWVDRRLKSTLVSLTDTIMGQRRQRRQRR